jgi:hypothetical protein
MSKARVFISYSSRDSDWAQAFAQSLKDFGADVWIERWQIAPGETWPAAFEKALRESGVIAVVVNPAQAFRPDLLFEVGAAVGMGKRLVPIVPKDFERSELPYPLRVRQGIPRESPQETAKKLVAATHAE